MRTRIIATVIYTLCLLMASLSLAADDLPKQGDLIKGSYQVYEEGLFGKRLLRSIPLPEGDWVVVNAWDRKSVNNPYAKVNPINLREMVLAQIDNNNRLVAAIFFTTNLESRAYKWDPEYCKDLNNKFIYSNTYGTTLYEQRCTSIQPTGYLQSSTPGQNIVREFYNSKGVKFDSNAIMVQTSEYDQNANLLRLDLFYFPSTYGLENPQTGNLTMSPWFKTNYQQDPKKVKFLEGLEKWANEYSALQNKYFNGSDKPVEPINLYKYAP